MSDFKQKPNQPIPDDFSETTPNFRVPVDNAPNDWEKTIYNSPKQTPNQPIEDDWSKTYIPKNNQPSQEPDFNLTQANINLPRQEDFGGKREEYNATMPLINLPKAEREKYQNIAPVKDEKAEEKKGIPMWFWLTAMLMTFFFVAVFGLAIAYFVFFNKSGFTVVIKGSQPNSEYFVDGTRWSVTEGDGSVKLTNLKSGTRNIVIKHEGFKDFNKTIEGENGETEEVIAQQGKNAETKPTLPNDCAVIKRGEFAKAEKCANLALDQLPQNYTAEELTKALNIYIINFASGKFNIPNQNMTFLRRAASFIVKLPATTVLEVGGHTDNRGNQTSNQTLSDNRAKSVKDTLVVLGVKAEMLNTKGYGDTKPEAPNDTEDNRFLNRRIEYTVLSK